jgi:serine/threonine protein kinase
MEPKKPTDPDYLGDWKVTMRLGEGGFGTVFLATKGVQSAAIKVIKEEFLEDNSARDRIINEAETLSKLSDIYIGRILDTGLNESVPWLATEYVNGPTLQEQVSLDKPLEELAWFNLASNLFHALVTAHGAGVIHKDIKPSNIILGESGMKLIDFGISHVTGSTKSAAAGEFEGSHQFSAPENYIAGKNIPEMDVFSAASTLAYAGTGHSVWKGENPIQLLRSINEDNPNLEGLTQNQKSFLKPLFEKNPSDRPSSFDALQSSLGYSQFLIGKRRKPIRLKGRSSLRKIFSSKKNYAIIAMSLVFILLVGSLAELSYLTKPFGHKISVLTQNCKATLQSGTLDLAVESCAKAVAAGNLDANIYLARAQKAKGSVVDAKTTLQGCKNQNIACLSDYAYFFEKGSTALGHLKTAYAKGDSEAAWRIGNVFQANKDFSSAISWYEKGLSKDSAMSAILLSLYFGNKTNMQYSKAINYAKQAINGDITGQPVLLTTDHPVERLITSLYTLANDTPGEITFLKSCSNAKVPFCVSELASIYLKGKDYSSAKKWALIGADLQDGNSMYILGQIGAHQNSLLPKGTTDPLIDKEILGWYKKGAALGNVTSALALGFIGYGVGSGGVKADASQSCYWYQKAMTIITDRKGTYKELPSDTQDYKEASQFFQFQSCQNVLLGKNAPIQINPVQPAITASPAPTPSPSVSTQPSEHNKVKVSYPDSPNVIISNVYGAPWLNKDLKWQIEVSDIGENVPVDFNDLQFNDMSSNTKPWFSIPYKLITAKVGNYVEVDAVVDSIMLNVLTNQPSFCPRFRLVKEVSNQVTKIWNKGPTSACQTPYTAP